MRAAWCGLVLLGVALPAVAQQVWSIRFSASGSQLVRFEVESPSEVHLIGLTGLPPSGSTYATGLEFTPDGRLFACAHTIQPGGAETGLYLVNRETGVAAQVGPALGLQSPDVPVDLGWDGVTGRMYAVGGRNTAGQDVWLYEVDLDTGAFTPTLLRAPVAVRMAGLCFDHSGAAYFHDLITDRVYRREGGGLAPMAQPVGFDANFNQGLGFDYSRTIEPRIAWHLGFNGTTNRPELWRLDLDSGAGTFRGVVGAISGATFADAAILPHGLGCAADFNGDGQVDFFDYLDFVAAFAAEDPSADFNGDGQIDFFDYLDFVAAFAEGCD